MATLLSNVVKAVKKALLPAPGIEEAEDAMLRSDMPAAIAILKRLSGDGDPEAGRMLGVQYAFGDLEYRDPVEAMRLFHVAADAGSALALVHIGELHHVGRGVPQDVAAAIDFYRRGAEGGERLGALLLGTTLLEGDGDVAADPDQAVVWLRRAVDAGSGDATLKLGEIYRDGLGVARDYQEALFFFRAGAAEADSGCERCLGAMYDNGLGVAEDPEEAFCWYVRAAAGGDAEAAADVGLCYALGRGVEKDAKLAAFFFEAAAEDGCSRGEQGLEALRGNGLVLEDVRASAARAADGALSSGSAQRLIMDLTWKSPIGPVTHDTGVEYLQHQLAGGDMDAAFMLAMLYDRGQSVPEDPAEALRLFRLCADAGDANAERSVGIMYLHGRGVRADEAEALRWTRRAADHGSAEAMADLGEIYLYGTRARPDPAAGMDWMAKAADAGSARGMTILGQQYVNGKIVPQDLPRGMALLQCAAALGDARAMGLLGTFCAVGRFGEQDLAGAEVWLIKSVQAGDTSSEEILEGVQAERLGYA